MIELRVVDRSEGIAGAYCAKLLTDLGADVVYRDRADASDPLFTYLRTSQRWVDDVAPWIAHADVVIDRHDVPAPQPPVTVLISAMGHGGPDDDLALSEHALQARCGSLANHGHMQRSPITVGGRLGEYITGAFAALGTLTAWTRASRTGVPEVVDVAQLEAMQMTFTTAPTLMARFPGGRKVSWRWVMIPGNEPTGDNRYVGITTVTTQQWQALARLIGRPEMADDDELGTMLGRFMRADEVNGALHAWTSAHSADDIVDACAQARVPVAIVGNGEELLRHEQLVARDVFVEQPGEAFLRPRAPFRFHGVGDRVLAAPAAADAPWTERAAPLQSALDTRTGERPLAGLKVLDFTAFWAGPFATAWLCAMGADVIKVEAVQRPDGMRLSATVRPHQDALFYEKSALFHASNLGKRGITLDLSQPDGLAIAKRLVEQCDVIAENFTPQVMERFGLDWETVHALNPRAIYLRIPAFGLSGPWRERGGFAQTMEQLTGMAWVTGYEDGPPIIPGGAVDPMSGTHAALAVVAALEHRGRTGEGSLVEVPLAEVAAAVTGEQVIRYTIDKTLMTRNGTRGVFRCAGDDTWVAIDPDVDLMPPDERAEWCATRTPDEVVADLLGAVPAAAMVPGHATLHDPQMRARGFFELITHEHVDDQHYPSWPMRLSAGPHTYWTGPAPTLGQHNVQVLRDELGLDDDELARLEAAHVIGTTPLTGH
jgi:crotonobetainyl-CoA:carnitine CoA-transferase CaiB-like acyl-CoA transferase